MKSIVQQRGRVPFPAHIGERVYMREFRKDSGLPTDLRRWQSTVDAMLDGVDTDGPLYLMIDQSRVMAGQSHRRSGLHVDGYWVPTLHAHGGGHKGRHVIPGDDREWPPEALLLASDVIGCRAMIGNWRGVPGAGGDCRHIDTKGLSEVIFDAGFSYAGNVTMLHESLPVAADCLRTLIRINVPGWSPEILKDTPKDGAMAAGREGNDV